MEHAAPSVNRLAMSATIHCLTGCAIGEVLGLVIASQLGWDDLPSIVLAVVLAFVFGYALTLRPLLASRVALGSALGLAFAADTLSITVMEIVDNAIILAIPGAMDAGVLRPAVLGQPCVRARCRGRVAFPLNRWLIERGRGHAVLNEHHHWLSPQARRGGPSLASGERRSATLRARLGEADDQRQPRMSRTRTRRTSEAEIPAARITNGLK